MTQPPRRYSMVLASLVISVACNTGTAPVPEPKPTDDPAAQLYGDPLGDSPAISLTRLLEDPQPYEGKPVTVSGFVRRACQVKGCWMELAESRNDKSGAARITFKNYAFFVPKDSAGATATAEGIVQTKLVDAAEVAHLEKDGAGFPFKRADGTVQEVRLVASGVTLKR